MLTNPNLIKAKPAEAAILGGLEFVWTTTTPSYEKDNDCVYIYLHTSPNKPRS